MQGLQLFGEDNLKASDWMAIEQAEQDAQADRMVVLSDVWLDKPEVLDQLHTVFSGPTSHLLATGYRGFDRNAQLVSLLFFPVLPHFGDTELTVQPVQHLLLPLQSCPSDYCPTSSILTTSISAHLNSYQSVR